jgi:hypothetical protein
MVDLFRSLLFAVLTGGGALALGYGMARFIETRRAKKQ